MDKGYSVNERDFCYWLQGMFELTNANELTAEQVQQIKDHLGLVFNKKTPQYPNYSGYPSDMVVRDVMKIC